MRNTRKMKIYLILLLLFGFFSISFSQDGIPNPPSPPKLYVNLSKQFPSFLNANEAAQLEKELSNFEKETSNEIVVVIVDNFNGTDRADFAIKLGEKWKVGKGKEDNGVVILIKPTKTDGKRTSFIATGRGLEGAIPDATCKNIVDKELNPLLKESKNYEGIKAALIVITKLAKGEYNHKDYDKKEENPWWAKLIIIGGIILFIIILNLRRRNGGGFGGIYFGGGGFGGGSGGSSGGGFGGFGGGSFGGGGAGGDW